MEVLSEVLSLLLSYALVAMCNAGNDPRPNPSAVVTVGKARFTVLTDRLVRMEWGQTVDAATFTFINRNLSPPKYQHATETDPSGKNWTVIITESVKVEYLPRDNETFSADNLKVTVSFSGHSTKTWSPQPAHSTTEYDGNLLGTVRTLDGELGPLDLNCLTQKRSDLHCTFGLISTAGYVVVDDTGHPQFNESSDWPWVVNQSLPAASSASCSAVNVSKRRYCGLVSITQFDCIGKGCCYDSSGSPSCYYPMEARQDLYFFGHGDNYKQALADFILVSGPIPIPPRYAFGIFYSRYWAYDDTGEMELVRGYEDRNIPLDVLVTDMDWHITFYKESSEGKKDQAGEQIGWTGFTWDKHLFPNPQGFLDWCKTKKLKNTLNLHPASGIQPWEDSYSHMAKAMGIDPSTNKYVPFHPTDKKFVNNFFKLVIHPLEKQGIDFWWLDWQQGEDWIKIPLVNPTFWLNYLFFTDSYSWNNSIPNNPPRRAFLLHRWGGLGNHRYQVGFSGDVFPAWSSLEFQVKFTLRATNVLFGYWSHDIGGHLTLPPPELYTRWVQWGAFSPIFRTHCTKNALNDRRIWVFPLKNYKIMRKAMIQRTALVPYIYTQAYIAHKTGLSILRPMYYEYPTVPEAMKYGDTQYFFGEDILVGPITGPVDNVTLLAKKEIWIPEGVFISWDNGDIIKGPDVIVKSFLVSEMPVFSKAGSIIPMRTDGFSLMGSAQDIPNSIKFMIFVGTANQGRGFMYEDDGFSDDYLNNPKSSAITNISFVIDESSPALLTIAMDPVASADQFIGIPSSRLYQLALPYFWPADQVVVNGKVIPYCALRDSLSDYHHDCWTYCGPKVTLIINAITPILINEPLKVVIDFESHISDDMTVLHNFVKSSRRLQLIKVLLDDQWTAHPIYQENYYNLLSANEIGNLITYTPSQISSYLDSFNGYYKAALNEINQIQLNDTLQMRINSWLNT